MSTYSSPYIKPDHESDLPLDSVQQILWDPYDRNCRTFFTASWDGYVRMYEIQGSSNKRLEKRWEYYFHHPVLTLDVTQDRLVIVGLASGQVGVVDIRNVNNVMVIGEHLGGVFRVFWVEKFQVVVTVGYDTFVKVFSLKNAQNNNYQISQYTLPSKTFTASFSFPYLLLGSQDSKIALLNIQKISTLNIPSEYQQIYDQSHGYIKYTASVVHTGKGRIILGTADGRIINTTFTEGVNGIRISKPVVNRYQKKSSYRKELVGMINGIDFGVKDGKYEFGVFCGTEEMATYSTEKSLRIKTLGSSGVTVTAISVSPDCEYYAFATGTDWCKGMEELSSSLPIKINVGRLTSSDVTTLTSNYR